MHSFALTLIFLASFSFPAMSATTGDCLIANQFLCQEQCGKVLIQCLGVGIGVALGPLDEAAAVCNLGVIDFAANCVQAPSLSGQTTTTAASAGVANVPTSIASTAIPAAATLTPAACAGIVYTVKSGDVCSTIAATNGATTGDLVILNQDICGAANQNNLQVGATLCIVPGAAANAGPTIPADALNTAAYIKMQPCTGHVDIVMSGATCTAIATQFGITLAVLKAATIPGQCDKLEAADAICIPGSAGTPVATVAVNGQSAVAVATTGQVTVAVAANGQATAAATPLPGTACTGIVYTVKSGDVCSTIAATNGATTGDLVILNQDICGAANQNNLQVGATLCIVPGAAANVGPTIPADALNTAAYIKMQPCTGHVDIVMSGATCTAIATQFGITLAALKAATIPGQCDKLEAADAICIPGSAATPVATVAVNGQAAVAIATNGQATVAVATNGQATAAATPLPGTACAGIVYTVKSGDVCSTIAATNGATTGDLVILNQDICGAANQNNLQVGATLCIVPGAAANVGPTIPADALNTAAYIKTQPCTGHVDIVMSGATCTGIASQFGITLAALKAATIPGQCDKLEAADAICVPGNKSQIAPTVSAPVRRFAAV